MAILRPQDSAHAQELPSIHTQIWPYTRSYDLLVLAGMNGGNTLAAFVGMLQDWTSELGEMAKSVRMAA